MREIKFRAWSLIHNEMRFNPSMSCKDGKWSLRQKGPSTLLQEDMILEQFTGLRDKNAVEIYEGDILGGSIGAPVHWCEKRMGWAFTFDDECACYMCSGDTELSEYDLNELEVIGNIHQNPELLK